MATIKDVANLSGFSVATVSRTLNQPEHVTEETRQRVMDAVRRLNYSPNYLGKNLRQLRTKRILVVLSSISNQFYSRVLRGIEDKAREQDYNVLIFTTRDLKKNTLEALNLLQSKVVDGAIFMTAHQVEKEISELNRSFPIVCACEPVADDDIPCVTIDNYAASREATEYLLNKGKRRIALLSIESELLDNEYLGKRVGSAVLREKGYRDALEEHGIPADDALIIREGFTYKSGVRGVEKLLSMESLPDAVFALSDACAIGALRAFSDHGIRTPEDISVVGFDNTAISEVYTPSVTTIAQPQYHIGEKAMELLFDRINGKDAQSVFMEHRLICRESVS